MHMIAPAPAIDDGPSPCASARRGHRPRAAGAREVLQSAKGPIIREGTKIAILNLGTRLQEC